MSWISFCKKIRNEFGSLDVTIKKGVVTIKLSDGYSFKFIDREIYEKFVNSEKYVKFQNNYLFTNDNIEMMVENIARDRIFLSYDHVIMRYNHFLESINQTYFDSFSFATPSLTYLLFLFEKTAIIQNDVEWLMRRFFMHSTKDNTEDCLKQFLSRLLNVQLCVIISRFKKGKKLKFETVQSGCESILLNFAINQSIPIRLKTEPKNKTSNLIPLNASHSINLFKISDYFIADKYKQAISASQIDTKYLFFYQIIERLAQRVAPKILLDESKKIISSKNKESNFEKFRKVQSKLKDDNELSILVKMIEINIDKDLVKNSLLPISVSYYETNIPSFVTVESTMLKFDTQSNFARTTGTRIYKIRNAIVHGKDENFKKGREIPFDYVNDFKKLEKELPLVKVVCEYAMKVISQKR